MDDLDKRIAERLGDIVFDQIGNAYEMRGGKPRWIPGRMWGAMREKEAEEEWKDVRKELPPNGQMVLLWVWDDAPDSGWQEIGMWFNEIWMSSAGPSPFAADITIVYWRALPAPPRTEEGTVDGKPNVK